MPAGTTCLAGSRVPGPRCWKLLPATNQSRKAMGWRTIATKNFSSDYQQANAEQRNTLLQTYIAETVASIMEVELENLSADQPLSALGLDSLMGMELKATLESQLGLNLPMSSLLDSPSVGKLAELAGQALAGEMDDTPGIPGQSHRQSSGGRIRHSSSSALFATGLRWPRKETMRPLFCIHPVGGDVRCYFKLAQAIPDDWPVWALRPRGLDSLSGPHRSMDELAKDYLARFARSSRQVL